MYNHTCQKSIHKQHNNGYRCFPNLDCISLYLFLWLIDNGSSAQSTIKFCRKAPVLAVFFPFLNPDIGANISEHVFEEFARFVVLAHQFIATVVIHVVFLNILHLIEKLIYSIVGVGSYLTTLAPFIHKS